MRQKIEEQVDTAYDIRVTYENLVHEVDFKTMKLSRLFAKMTDVKQEIKDVSEEYNRERRELQMEQDLLLKYVYNFLGSKIFFTNILYILVIRRIAYETELMV